MKKLVYIIPIAIYFVACSKAGTSPANNPPDPYASYKSLILGTWNWHWAYIYDSSASGVYQNLQQHLGGTFRFTTDSFYVTELDTSIVFTPGVGNQISVDTTSQSTRYRISSDSLFTTDSKGVNDTFLVSATAHILDLVLYLHTPGRLTVTSQTGYR